MADSNISSLSGIDSIEDSDLFLAQHNNAPVKVTGEQLTDYISRSVTAYDVTIVDSDVAGGATVTGNTLHINMPRGPGIKSVTGPQTLNPNDPYELTYTLHYQDTKTSGGTTVPGGTGTFVVHDGRPGAGQVNKVMGISPSGQDLDVTKAALMNLIYPVGSIYMSVNSTSPATLFGMGTWMAIEGRFLVGVGHVDGDPLEPEFESGDTGGTVTEDLTQAEVDFSNGQADIGWHDDHADALYNYVDTSKSFTALHKFTATAGAVGWAAPDSPYTVAGIYPTRLEGTQDIDLPPYLAVYMWKRTA